MRLPADSRAGAALLRKSLLLGAAAAAGLGGLAAAGHAAEWYASPEIGQEFQYDDNVGFTTDDAVSTWGSTTSAGLTVGGRNEVLDISLESRFDFVRFPAEDKLSSDDQYLTLNGTHRGERHELSLRASFERDTTRNDTLDDTGLRILDNERRLTYSVEPGFSWQLTPTQTLSLFGLYRERIYPDSSPEEGGLQDYSQYVVGTSWSTSLSPRLALGIGASAGLIDSDTQRTHYGSIGPILTYALSPRLQVDLRAGPTLAVIETDQPTASGTRSEDDTNLGYSADAGIHWQATRRSDAELRFTRSVEPFGANGDVVERDRLRLVLGHELSPRLRLFATGTLQRQSQIGARGDDQERVSLRFEPGVRWALAEDLDLSLRYRLRYQEFEDPGRSATSNAVFLGLSWQLPQLRTSW